MHICMYASKQHIVCVVTPCHALLTLSLEYALRVRMCDRFALQLRHCQLKLATVGGHHGVPAASGASARHSECGAVW